jgi:hypothetical protein
VEEVQRNTAGSLRVSLKSSFSPPVSGCQGVDRP